MHLFVDFWKINNLISDNYMNNKHPINTLTDAEQQMTRKTCFVKLINPKRIIAWKWQINVLKKCSHSMFPAKSFQTEDQQRNLTDPCQNSQVLGVIFLDPVIKADLCAHYGDHIGIAVRSPKQLISNLRASFKCIWKIALEFSLAKNYFSTSENRLPRKNYYTKRNNSSEKKITKLLVKIKFRRSEKWLLYIGFLVYYHNHTSFWVERMNPFFQLFKTTENKVKS